MKKIHYIITLLAVLTLAGCGGKDDNLPKVNNRTVLVYMVADNNLYSFALDNINQMESVWEDSYEGTLLVYLNPKGGTTPSRLYEVKRGQGYAIESKIIKEYGLSENASDPAVLTRVIADSRTLAPANSYGLIMWSHATGWIPGASAPQRVAPKDGLVQYSFGNNDTYHAEMEIGDLARALPSDVVFDFIAFDACYMAGVEVAYELRNNTKYMIASTSETWAEGLPYNQIIPDLMSKTANVIGITTKAFNYASTLPGRSPSSTMSLIDCTKLEEVASSLKDIIQNGTATLPPVSTIQKFAVNSYLQTSQFYDLGDFVNKTWSNSPGLTRFNSAVDNAILIDKSTPMLFGNVSVNAHCGLSCYIPLSIYPKSLGQFRTQFAWSVASGLATQAF